MPNVGFIRPEIKAKLPAYEMIQDCIEGETQVKYRKAKYLPIPNPTDLSPENAERYKAYLERAQFFNVAQQTLAGLAGQPFLREAVVELPQLLAPVAVDATGSGVSLIQLAKKATRHVLGFGRSGIFTDYPVTETGASRAQIESGEVRPTLKLYEPWKIINWRTTQRGSRILLCLVVLEEETVTSDDGFEIKLGKQWRVLSLENNNIYKVEVYKKENADYKVVEGPFYPSDASGKNLTEIPFSFIGSENNDVEVDLPPLYDLASVNISHYRNSADYEEACFILGQPTPVFSGLTEEWVNNVLKGKVVFGSRSGIPLPTDASATLLQASANTMVKEAMEAKERQMVALGAKLVEQRQVQRTATEASIENTSETSTLVSSAKNVSEAFKNALEWCAVFVGETKEIKFELPTDFDLSKMTPEERKQVIAEWQNNAITFSEMRAALKKGGIAKLDEKEAIDEMVKEEWLATPWTPQTAAARLAEVQAGMYGKTLYREWLRKWGKIPENITDAQLDEEAENSTGLE